ncbi:MAG TPA: sigma-54 dependent transcriptional regulator, partial [candidate division Zixibacteria bacterium]|nr:sigma-54 dependent transcriptional regulator [candidate division Zixibacteria bacterium]
GQSRVIREIRDLITLVGPSDSAALITGPSGSGKELVARALHAASGRSEGRFVAINCGAFPESLLESELFGHERGAFTGAEKRKIGRFELADGGTLFLDEIGEAPLTLQVKLLRALETKQIERLGSETSIPVDFRLVAATNRDLKSAISRGSFREDLYYRLNVVSIILPPLTERVEDIEILAERFLAEFAQKSGKRLNLSDDARALLRGYTWPGNVRELQNMIERAVTLARSETLGPELFSGLGTEAPATAPEKLADIERAHIERMLTKHHWSIQLTAEKLGIHRNTLTQKIKEYGLNRE